MKNSKNKNNKKMYNVSERQMGRVLNWNTNGQGRIKEYGFIRSFKDGESYYCNLRGTGDEGGLIPDSIVEFELWKSKIDENSKFATKIIVVEVPDEDENDTKRR